MVRHFLGYGLVSNRRAGDSVGYIVFKSEYVLICFYMSSALTMRPCEYHTLQAAPTSFLRLEENQIERRHETK